MKLEKNKPWIRIKIRMHFKTLYPDTNKMDADLQLWWARVVYHRRRIMRARRNIRALDFRRMFERVKIIIFTDFLFHQKLSDILYTNLKKFKKYYF